jgi:hypothetical protein
MSPRTHGLADREELQDLQAPHDPQAPQDLQDLQDLQVRPVRASELGGRITAAQAERLRFVNALSQRSRSLSSAGGDAAHVRPAVVPPAPSPPSAVPPAVPATARPAAREAPSTPAAATAPRPKTAAAATASNPRSRILTWKRFTYALLLVVLFLGWRLPTERYITPTRGLGYALGIIGGSLMLLLLLYSARKHFRWLSFLGPTPQWFRFHMVLGILGPLCILFHSNFSTGAANSNVALFSMLIVAASGFIGRYLYAHMHHGLYGSKLALGELQAGAAGLRELSGRMSFMPDLVARLEADEQRVLACGSHLPLLGFLKPLLVGAAALRARWRLHRYIRRGLHASARKSPVVAAQAERLRHTARLYVDRRLAATRRVAQFEGYERLFSLWHALHIPLIFMLIIAAVVHVIAVNVY